MKGDFSTYICAFALIVLVSFAGEGLYAAPKKSVTPDTSAVSDELVVQDKPVASQKSVASQKPVVSKKSVVSRKSSTSDKSAKKSYNKVLKNGTSKEKLEFAEQAYNSKSYKKAIAIYEDMLPFLRGREGLEEVLYRLAYGYYYESDYFMGSHYFRLLTRQFPNGSYLEEAMYMAAYCKSMESLYFRLDQTATKDAIKQLQLFVNYYPKSQRVAEANGIIDKMRAKLARKSFEIANMYYRRDLYNAAAIAYNNFLREYPESSYREEAMYKLVKSRYLYADKSIAAKQPERYAKVIESYEMFYRNFQASKYMKELNRYKEVSSNIKH
ncbi:MAG: outer membrane protein assembly factor BamD [Bacteroidales bacterium]|jgi:outer membrane protein assembly factor BamD|nr:outer membrane protein assembly factor BamD [Bacteroidales bacterium]